MDPSYKSWRDIPPETDSAVFSLLWGDIARVIEAAGIGDELDDALDHAPAWDCQEGGGTDNGWSFAAAILLGAGKGGKCKPRGPRDRVEYICARAWKEMVHRGVGVALDALGVMG